MKNRIVMAIVALVFLASGVASADLTDTTIDAFAKVVGSNLKIQAKTFGTNEDAWSIQFGNVTPDSYKAPGEYIEITYANNSATNGWAILLNTNNSGWTGAAVTPHGGLLGSVNKNQNIPMLWQARKTVETASPLLSQTELDSGHWTFVDDKTNQGWVAGDPLQKLVVGDKDGNSWIQGWPEKDKSPDDIDPSPARLYFGAKVDKGIVPDSYTTTLIFELLNW